MQAKRRENSILKERILEYLDSKGISKYECYQKTGISRSVLSQSNGMTEDNILKFLAAYSDISLDWLLSGRGNMLRADDIQLAPTEVESEFPLHTDHKIGMQSIPLYELDATAGLIALFDDRIKQIPISHLQIPNLPSCDGAIYVHGDSMYPLLKSGDIICYKEVAPSYDSILWGEMYLLAFVLESEIYVSVKYIQKADDDDKVRLVSHNQYHAPKDIPAGAIRALALVKASVRYNTMG